MLIATAALLFSVPATAQVYKCKEGATTVFSSIPCAADARRIDVRPAAGGGGHCGACSGWHDPDNGGSASAGVGSSDAAAR